MGGCYSKTTGTTPVTPPQPQPPVTPEQDSSGTILDPNLDPTKIDPNNLVDGGEQPQGEVAEATEALVDAAGELVEVVQDKVEDAAEVVADTLGDVAEAVGEHVKDMAAAGYDAAEGAAETVADAVGDAKDAVVAKVEPVLEPVVDAAEAVAKTISRARDEIVEDAQAVGAVASAIARRLEPVTEAVAEVARATARVVGAAAVAVGAVVGEAVFPNESDKTVTMIPYFKISSENLELWKAQCDKFYTSAQVDEGMLFYAFYYEQSDDIESGEVHIRQGFKDVSSFLEHLRNIDVPLQLALQLSQLLRVEIHASAEDLDRIKAVQTSLGKEFFEYYEVSPYSVRRTTPYDGSAGGDRTITFSHYYDLPDVDTSSDCIKDVATTAATGMEFVSVSVSGKSMQLHQGFRDADAAVQHLSETAVMAAKLRANATLARAEMHGPAEELAKFRSQMGPQVDNVQKMFARDDQAVRRTYEKMVEDAHVVSEPPELFSATPRLQKCSPWSCGC